MARKPTKAEAREKLESLPDIPPFLGGLGRFYPPARFVGKVAGAAKQLAGLMIDVDPLGRTSELTPSPPPVTPPRTQNEAIEVKRSEVVQNMINDPMIKLTPEMVDIVNNDAIMMSPTGQLMSAIDIGTQLRMGPLSENGKKKRKVSKYQKLLGKNLKMLKKKHPRTPITKLMKKAHLMTKRALR